MGVSIKYKLRTELLNEGDVVEEGLGSAVKAATLAGAMAFGSPSMGQDAVSVDKTDQESEIISTHKFGSVTNSGIDYLKGKLGLNKPLRSITDSDLDNAVSLINDTLIADIIKDVDTLGYQSRIQNVEHALNWVKKTPSATKKDADGVVDKTMLIDLVELLKWWKSKMRDNGKSVKIPKGVSTSVMPHNLLKK
tara:strand:- start:3941 stop:4519 length:579 start_codon:yes stop_codon:yes gene_type:complete